MAWTTAKKVTFIVKKDIPIIDGNNTLYKAYVVFDNNKKQLESGKNWARYGYDVVSSVDNKGFSLTIHSSADSSSVSGKLSFWMCKIGNIPGKYNELLVGINSEILCALLKQSKFDNGKCLQPLEFARYQGSVCMLHDKMVEYKQMETEIHTKKTVYGTVSKMSIGKEYETTSGMIDVYLGQLYGLMDIGHIPSSWDINSNNKLVISLHKKPKERYTMVYRRILLNIKSDIEKALSVKITTMSELLSYGAQYLDNANVLGVGLRGLFSKEDCKKSKPKRLELNNFNNMPIGENYEDSFNKFRQSLTNRMLKVQGRELVKAIDRSSNSDMSKARNGISYCMYMYSALGNVTTEQLKSINIIQLADEISNRLKRIGLSQDLYEINIVD